MELQLLELPMATEGRSLLAMLIAVSLWYACTSAY
jgi:hypothetical protein